LNQDSTALGSVNGGTVIADGATLDVNGYNLKSEPVTVSGAGVNGEGAIVENTGDPAFHSPGGANLAYVTLAGDTTFGGTGRLDFRSNPSSGTNAAFYTGGQPYKITLVGTNQIQFTGVQIDPALGDIDVREGTLGIETSTTLGNSASNLFVHAGSRLLFYQLYAPVEKQVHLSGDGTNDTIYAQSSQSDGQNILAGPIDITGNCLINVASGYDLTFSNIVSGTGGLTLTAAGTLHLTGMAANTWSGGLTINAGTLQIGDGQADGSIPATAITNNGALVFNSANDMVVADEISGTGTLEQDGPGKLTLTGTDTFTGATTVTGGILQVDGSMIGNGDLTVSGGTLAGSGTLLGNVSIQAGGTLAPGDSIGTLNIIGSLTLAGTNEMQLSKSGSTLTNDMITGISSLTLGGTLMLDISGDALAAGDQFQLYSATFIVPGSFTDIEPAQPGAGLVWDTSELASQGILKVAGTTSGAPAIGGVSVAGGNMMFTVTGGTAGATLQVLSSTNLAAPLANWTSVETNQFDASGNFSFTNAVDDQPQQFYIIQQQ
jgi:autotransporter-associated beta strand protein